MRAIPTTNQPTTLAPRRTSASPRSPSCRRRPAQGSIAAAPGTPRARPSLLVRNATLKANQPGSRTRNDGGRAGLQICSEPVIMSRRSALRFSGALHAPAAPVVGPQLRATSTARPHGQHHGHSAPHHHPSGHGATPHHGAHGAHAGRLVLPRHVSVPDIMSLGSSELSAALLARTPSLRGHSGMVAAVLARSRTPGRLVSRCLSCRCLRPHCACAGALMRMFSRYLLARSCHGVA